MTELSPSLQTDFTEDLKKITVPVLVMFLLTAVPMKLRVRDALQDAGFGLCQPCVALRANHPPTEVHGAILQQHFARDAESSWKVPFFLANSWAGSADGPFQIYT